MAGSLIPSQPPFGEIHLTSGPHERSKHKEVLYEIQKGHCYYCGKRITRDEATIDHIIPREKGGANTLANKVLACGYCNHKKGNEWPYKKYEYARSLWLTQGVEWVRTDIEYRPYMEAALRMGDAELKQEFNDMPIGTTVVKTKKGWSMSICNRLTDFERVSVRNAQTLEEGLLALKDAYLRYLTTNP